MTPNEEQLAVLQNLEAIIVSVWRANPTMTDYAVQRAYEGVFQFYRAEARGHTPKELALTGIDAEAYEAVKEICELRLGRGSNPRMLPPVSIDTLMDCLRELQRSVERHTKNGGRQGYLQFIKHFVS